MSIAEKKVTRELTVIIKPSVRRLSIMLMCQVSGVTHYEKTDDININLMILFDDAMYTLELRSFSSDCREE